MKRLTAITMAALVSAFVVPGASAHPYHHHGFRSFHRAYHHNAGHRYLRQRGDFRGRGYQQQQQPPGFGIEAGPLFGFHAGPEGFGFHVGPLGARIGDRGAVVGGRPHGCPYEYCGCEASLTIFGRIVGGLNLAANWLHFPRVPLADAQGGMAAVAPSRHHVTTLIRHVSGPYWLVHDGNWGHRTINHVRNLAGFTVVSPRAV